MNTIEIKTPSKNYHVVVGHGLLDQAGELILDVKKPCKAVLVADETVDNLYGDRVAASLEAAGFTVYRCAFLGGEDCKSLGTLMELLEFCGERQLSRTDMLVALGGGITGDLTGFAAAVYLRGISYIQMPTTLLAAVDSSVGGKTAVNLTMGKNLAGAFHQPDMVICDCDTFNTLPPDVFSDGVAEALKMGALFDEELFEYLRSGAFEANIAAVVARAVELKAAVVGLDEHDHGLRQLLNYGHTLGHAIEHCSSHQIRHGQAIAAGMHLITRAAENTGLAEPGLADTIQEALLMCGLPTDTIFSPAMLCNASLQDKKIRGDQITLAFPSKIGSGILHNIPTEKLEEFMKAGWTS